MPETLSATTRVEVTQLAGNIGAEITGVDTGVHAAARQGDTAGRRRHALGQHRLRLPEHAGQPARARGPAADRAHERVRLRPPVHRGGAGRPRAPCRVSGVRLHRLRERAPAGAGAPGDRRAVAGARGLRQKRRRAHPAGVTRPDQGLPGVHHPARAHGPLALARGRPGDLGQPSHPALRDRGLRDGAPPRRARHCCRACTGRRGRAGERRGQGRRRRLLRRRRDPQGVQSTPPPRGNRK